MVAPRRLRAMGTNLVFALVSVAALGSVLVMVDLGAGSAERHAIDDWGLCGAVVLLILAAAVVRRAHQSTMARHRAEGLEPGGVLVADLATAVELERRRIAGDLHDIVAHAISVMVLQSVAGRSVLDTDLDAARRMIEGVEQSGRHALDELRRLLDTLEPCCSAPAPAASSPGLADLGALVARATDAGLPSSLTITSPLDLPRELPSHLQVTVYRVVQESLTNALRYAMGALTQVHIIRSHDRLVVTVENASTVHGVTMGGTGHGLTVMSDRVAAHRGSMTAGPTTGNGWLVRVVLPLAAVDRAAHFSRRRERI